MAPKQVGHLAVEQGVKAVVDDTHIPNVQRTGPPKPVLEWAA